jgi:hypothetical protein
MGLNMERAKIYNALGQFTNDWIEYGVSIVSDGKTNVRGRPLINILVLSVDGVVFLSSHDYLDRYTKTIQKIGLFSVIEVITNIVGKATREII